jgi:hypothetical protein
MQEFRCRGHKTEARQSDTALFQEKSSIHICHLNRTLDA